MISRSFEGRRIPANNYTHALFDVEKYVYVVCVRVCVHIVSVCERELNGCVSYVCGIWLCLNLFDAPRKAMNTKVIPDLSAALTLAGKAGLKEHQMIHEARALLTKPFGIVFSKERGTFRSRIDETSGSEAHESPGKREERAGKGDEVPCRGLNPLWSGA